MSLPINFLGREFAEAKLQIVEPVVENPIIPLHFNPSEYRLRKETTHAEIPVPGVDSRPSQWLGGGAEVLSMDLLVDTSDDLTNVREKYVARLQELLKRNEKWDKPPILDFVWDGPVFRGVLQSLDVTYVMFHSNGMPLRAKLAVVMREERSVEEQEKAAAQNSCAVEKRYVVRAGETLSSIAAAVFRDPSQWRAIATANDITDPRSIAPGSVLTVPRHGAQRA